MKFVTENHIDKAIESLNHSDTQLESLELDFAAQQPAVVQFITQEGFDVLTMEEKDLLHLLGLTIWRAATEAGNDLPELTVEDLGEAEEANYQQLESVAKGDFKAKMDLFFTDYPQEDLLALVEDALCDDEEDMVVTPEGRDLILVTLKSLIDAFEDACGE